MICDDWLSNKVSKPSKLLYHRKTKHPAIKCKSLEFFKGGKKKVNMKNKQLLKATTSSNVSALSIILRANCIAKGKKSLTIGEELILSAAKVHL
jgi:hypothetical protein